MFWGSFSYDRKGSFHCWKKKMTKKKKVATEFLKHWNKKLEPAAKQKWELTNEMRQLQMNWTNSGKKPQWKFTVKREAVTQGKERGGIDWYHYQKVILEPKLIPFVKECMVACSDTVIQKDKASAHNLKHQKPVYVLAQVKRFLWPGNSPDLNAIEPTWFYMKQETTRKGAPQAQKTAESVWTQVWKDLSQSMIQRWIERIPHHIQKVICLEGANEYRERALDDKENRVRRTEDERQQSQRYVGATARVKEAAEVVEAVEAVEAVDNDVEDVDESEWGSDVAIDLW